MHSCKWFGRAQESHTDNEGCEPLIYVFDDTYVDYGIIAKRDIGRYGMGSDLKPISFCPWCGEKVGKPRRDEWE